MSFPMIFNAPMRVHYFSKKRMLSLNIRLV